MAPLVSIGIPTYNGARYLRESIDSVLAQTFRDFELVLIDDASADHSGAIGEAYARKDPRIQTIKNSKRLGLVGNFNRCVELTNGRHVCVWHQDDMMMPQNIERKVALLEANPQVGFVHSNVLMIDDRGKVLSEHWEADSRRDYVRGGREFFLRMAEPGRNYVCCPSVLARRECYQKLGGFRSELYFACDLEMWMRLALYYDVACVGEPLVQFRRHRLSDSTRFEGTMAEIEQEWLAKTLVLADHPHRVADAATLKKRIVLEMARGELLRARTLFMEGNVQEAWKRLSFVVKIDPASSRRSDFLGTLVRLMLGPAVWRWIKSARRAVLGR